MCGYDKGALFIRFASLIQAYARHRFTHAAVRSPNGWPFLLESAFDVCEASGTRIEWNLIYGNADRGVQLYPDAQATTVDHNVIDGNGEGIIFSGDNGYASSNSNVYDNLLTNARARHDAESWWPAGNPIGTRNALHDNCIWGGARSPIDTSGGGFSAYRNLVVNPEYVAAAKHNYQLAPTSPCLTITGGIAAVVNAASPTVATPSSVKVRAARNRRRHRPGHGLRASTQVVARH